ncbi:kinase-like domain-containing protein [Cokeromyces recurvatus]|uniref:kinase-like domain-containing protein n=1 Tax=Cokeromyces recurvatus TaxID=90255 RepID=UPI00221E4BA0|nr:kinase-like domain-containing protein [Cokeromyces recurvatus]KAI7899271.1 kinase-like domain-containing protein [Cokeromyces recurvatus]
MYQTEQYTHSKQQLLAKYWIESILNIQLPSNDLYTVLKNGEILYKIVQFLVDQNQLPNSYPITTNDPKDKIQQFLNAIKDFGLQSKDLFNVDDLTNEENMHLVISTILVLGHVYSYKRLSLTSPIAHHKRSNSEGNLRKTTTRSRRPSLIIDVKDLHRKSLLIDEQINSSVSKRTSPSSGDSGYGSMKQQKSNKKVQDLFDDIFSPPVKLFSSLKKEKTPHYVKFQTWSTKTNEDCMTGKSPELCLSSSVRRSNSTSSTVIKDQTSFTKRSSLSTPLILNNNKDENDCLDLFDGDHLVARYKLGHVIGKGHFGTVFRALDLISGKTVAIKRIQQEQDIILQEARLLKSLSHPNIVKYEGFIKSNNAMYIVLEYVENGSLLATLKQFGNRLPEPLVATYVHDILKGLAYLHEKDVVHCDLKAANILTTKTGNVKLSDFGVSLNLKMFHGKQQKNDYLVSGTPFWMSPEVIQLKGASTQSDIWSLGCTIIELCTGKPPYSDLLTMTAMFKIVEEESPPIPIDLSDDLNDFLKLCFKKNPLERPKATYLLYHPWIVKNNNSRLDPLMQFLNSSNNNTTARRIPTTFPFKKKTMSELPIISSSKQERRRTITATTHVRQSMPPVKKVHEHKLIECYFTKG